MKIVLNGREYVFVNEVVNTRNGFAHISKLIDVEDGSTLSSAKVNYLNRTWERYQFQTSMRVCLDKLRDTTIDDGVQVVRQRNGMAPFKAGQLKALEQELAKLPMVQDIERALGQI